MPCKHTPKGNHLNSLRLQYLFSFTGRVNRLEFLISQAVGGVLLLVLFSLILEDPTDGVSRVAFFVMVVVAISLLAFGARRTRDTGVNQWWYLLILVPPVDFALWVFLLLVPTDEFRYARI